MSKKKDNLPVLGDTVRDRTWEYRRLGSTLLLSQADMDFLNALRPLCAVCRRPVAEITWTRAVGEMAVNFRVSCHGDTEETTVPMSHFHVLMNGGVQGGQAFAGPKKIGKG